MPRRGSVPSLDAMTQPSNHHLVNDRSATPTVSYRIGDLCRVGDVERSRTCDVLAEHYAAGRLSSEELERRLGWAVQAVTEADLVGLTADLPTSLPTERYEDASPGSRSWPAGVVVAAVALLVSIVVAGGMLLVLGLVDPLLFLAAGVGGCAAAAGGAAATYLVSVYARRGQPPGAVRSPAPR